MPDSQLWNITVPLCIGALELGKQQWHSRDAAAGGVAHSLGISYLACSSPASLLAGSISFLSLLASAWTKYDAGEELGFWRRRFLWTDRWHLLSALSSYPIELAALWGLSWYSWVGAAFLALLPWLLLRPAHWSRSMWDSRRFWS